MFIAKSWICEKRKNIFYEALCSFVKKSAI